MSQLDSGLLNHPDEHREGTENGTCGRHRPRHDQLRASAFSRAASPPSSPTPRAPGPRRPSSPSPRTARCSSARSPSARRSPTSTGPSGRSSATWAPTGSVDIDGKNYTPQEISARVLQKLKRDAEAYLGEKVTDAVITVPAYFNDAAAPGHQGGRRDRGPQRPAHRQRADRGRPGVRPGQGRRSRPSSSSTSAAAPSTCRCWRSATASIEVKATSGDNHLGGDDWDQRDRRPPGQAVPRRSTASTCPRTRWRMQRLREAAEKAKIELSGVHRDHDQPALHHGRRRGPAAPGREAHPRRVPAADRRTCWTAARARSSSVDQGRRHQAVRDRPRRPGRRLDPDARRRRAGQAS